MRSNEPYEKPPIEKILSLKKTAAAPVMRLCSDGSDLHLRDMSHHTRDVTHLRDMTHMCDLTYMRDMTYSCAPVMRRFSDGSDLHLRDMSHSYA